jgi:hypothetical protein
MAIAGRERGDVQRITDWTPERVEALFRSAREAMAQAQATVEEITATRVAEAEERGERGRPHRARRRGRGRAAAAPREERSSRLG